MPRQHPERRNIMAISLTAGMRSNLYNLQQTSKLMDQTAIRLNTGKKVNSALDDPISYFTAKEHVSRANDLGTLKNGMSEGIQTISAANNGVESIIALIAAAKSKAESAKSADFASETVTLNTVVAGNVITIGGAAYTATAADVTAGANEFNLGDTDALTAASLEALVNSNTSVEKFSGSATGNTITLSLSTGDITTGTVTVDTTMTEETILTGEKAELGSQYNELLSQIDALRDDSGYKGVNLLNVNDTLTVNFEGSNKIDVKGFDADYSSLNITTVNWVDNTENVDTDIAKLAAATATLESKASSLASSLSIVTVRQNFTENMINTLTTGADALTLADMNEEGANMLMLQTQQALGTSALSMSAQTAQGVLRLF